MASALNRTPEAKTNSSLNALKHGADAASVTIPGEDPPEYERLAADYRHHLRPKNVIESFQIDTIIRADWQRRRLRRIEANLYRALLAEGATPEEVDVTVLRDSPTGKLLLKVWRQVASLERAHSRALAELRKLRREADPIDEPEIPAVFDPLPELMAARFEKRQNKPNFSNGPAPGGAVDNPALRL